MELKRVGIVAFVLLSIPTALAAQTGEEQERPAVVVRSYNYSGVSGKDLQTARANAEAILRTAGIDVSWMDCWFVDREPVDAAPRCGQPRSGNELVLRLTAANPAPGKQFASMG